MPDAALALLQSHGYAVRFRKGEEVECLVTYEEEAWVGLGPSRKDALDAAVALACPSALSQALFQDALSDAPNSKPQPAVPAMSPPPAYVSHRKHPPLVARQARVAPTLESAIDELEILKARIRTSREDLGLCTPQRQRLAILAWICEARAHIDAFPSQARVRDSVATISRLLTELGKVYWPGSVTALQLQMTPRELPRHLLGASVSTWGRAAQLAEQTLESAVLKDDLRGYDAYGWADGAQLWPRTLQASDRMLALQTDIEKVAGRLDKFAAPKPGAKKPDAQTHLRWVRELRWLRGGASDPELWARLAGRLRWWAGRRDAGLQLGLRELEPGYAPEHSWSEVLGAADQADTKASRSHIDLQASLLDRVRARGAGLRLAWVGPRRDPSLLEALRGALKGCELTWCVSETSKLQALQSEIHEGGYDYVFGAVGLQDHISDLLLTRACRTGSTGYLRVFRGEPWSCLRALDRALLESA